MPARPCRTRSARGRRDVRQRCQYAGGADTGSPSRRPGTHGRSTGGRGRGTERSTRSRARFPGCIRLCGLWRSKLISGLSGRDDRQARLTWGGTAGAGGRQDKGVNTRGRWTGPGTASSPEPRPGWPTAGRRHRAGAREAWTRASEGEGGRWWSRPEEGAAAFWRAVDRSARPALGNGGLASRDARPPVAISALDDLCEADAGACYMWPGPSAWERARETRALR